MKTTLTSISPGCKNMALRMASAEENFLETLMHFGEINRADAVKVLALYRKLRLVKLDPVGGRISVKFGPFLDKQTIANALEQVNQ